MIRNWFGDIRKTDRKEVRAVLVITLCMLIFAIVSWLDFGNDISKTVDMMEIANDEKLPLDEGDVVDYSFYPYSRFDRIKLGVYGYDNLLDSEIIIDRGNGEKELFRGTLSDLKINGQGDAVTYRLGKPNKKNSPFHVRVTTHLRDASVEAGMYLTEVNPKAADAYTTINDLEILSEDLSSLRQLSVGLSIKSNLPVVVFVLTWIWMCIVVCTAVILINRRIDAPKLFAVLATFLSVVFFIYLPTYNINDGLYHYTAAYHFSNVLLGTGQDTHNHIYMRKSDAVNYEHDFQTDSTRYSPTARSLVDRKEHFKLFDTDTTMVETTHRQSVMWENPVQYIPATIGVTVARVCRLGTYPMLILCYIICMAVYIIIGYLAIKVTPVCKDAMVMILCLPVAIQEACSMSYDSITIALSMLTFAYVTRLIVNNRKLNIREWIVLISDILLMSCMKRMGYVTLFAILLWAVKDKWKKYLKYAFYACVVLFAIYVAGMELFGVKDVLDASNVEIKYTVHNIVTNPLRFIELFVTTVVARLDYYICSPFGSYLGWDQETAPVAVGAAFGIIITLVSLDEKESSDFPWDKWNKWIAVLILIGFVLEMHLIMMTDTRIARDTIYGVQGRYFIPFMPVATLLLSKSKIRVDVPSKREVCYTAYIIGYVVMIYYMMRLFLCR